MATPKRSALGRGLDALISMDNIVTSGTSSIHEIELSQIVPCVSSAHFRPLLITARQISACHCNSIPWRTRGLLHHG